MKKNMILSLTILMISTIAHAQTVETIFTIKDTKDGEQVVGVQYRNIKSSFEFDGFAQADKDNNGCLDRAEAREMGILDFDRFALSDPNCLNEEEYNHAIHATD